MDNSYLEYAEKSSEIKKSIDELGRAKSPVREKALKMKAGVQEIKENQFASIKGLSGVSTFSAKEMQNSWLCNCGRSNTGNFCLNCGSKNPALTKIESANINKIKAVQNISKTPQTEDLKQNLLSAPAYQKPDNTWQCGCGRTNAGKFCAACGSKRPGMN